MLFVVLFEHVFLLQEAEHDHGFVEENLHLGFRQSLHALLQLVVDEQRQVLRALEKGRGKKI